MSDFEFTITKTGSMVDLEEYFNYPIIDSLLKKEMRRLVLYSVGLCQNCCHFCLHRVHVL